MHQIAPSAAAALGFLLLSLLPGTSIAADKHAAPHASTPSKAQPAQAEAQNPATPRQIGGAQAWAAFAYTDKGGKVCYLVGHPAKSDPANASRGRVDALVTHRPGENAVNVVTFDVGYPFKEGADAELEVDGKKFTLFTEKEAAWARDAATDKQIVAALGKGTKAVLKGTSARGTATVDTYSLAGFGTTVALIDKVCGVKR
jgi:hypothetical protein